MSPDDPNKFYDIKPPEGEETEPIIGEDTGVGLPGGNDEQQPNLNDSARRYGSDQLKQLGKDKAKSALSDAGKKAGKEAAGSVAKKAGEDVAKTAAKQGAKQGSRVAAEAALGAETAGVGLAVAAADLAWQKRKLIIKMFVLLMIIFFGALILVLTGLNIRFAEPDDACAIGGSGATNNKVYIVGDSLGVGLKQVGIENKLKNKQWELLKINAVSGNNIQTALNQQVKPDKDIIKQAGVIIIELGTNPDSNYQQSLNNLYSYMKSQNESAKYYWINYVGFSPLSQGERNRLNQQNEKLTIFANRKSIEIINWASRATTSDYSGGEGLHPNSSGYTNMAKLAANSLGIASTDAGEGTTSICLDPGHTINSNTATDEAHGTFTVAKKVKTLLEEMGYKVYMTRDSAESITTPTGESLTAGSYYREGLHNRVKYCKSVNADYMFSIHFDTSNNGNAAGPYIIAPPKPNSSCRDEINPTQDYYEKNLDLAKEIQNGIATSLQGKQSISKDNVLIEGTNYSVGSHPAISGSKCVQLYSTEQAIKSKVDVSLIEIVPNPSWYLNHLTDTAKAIAKGLASALPTSSSGSCNSDTGGVDDLLNKAAEYVECEKNFPNNIGCSKFRRDAASIGKTETDCWGFVATSLKYSVDGGIKSSNVGCADPGSAGESLVSRKPDLYERVPGLITSTRQLKPGDLLFKNTGNNCNDGNGHAMLYVGSNFSACGSGYNAASASYGGHGPQCSNWYGDMSVAYRLKR